jgi:hypothetical protein
MTRNNGDSSTYTVARAVRFSVCDMSALPSSSTARRGAGAVIETPPCGSTWTRSRHKT